MLGYRNISGNNTIANKTIIQSVEVLTSTTINEDLVVDTNTLVVNSGSNKVGILTTLPTEALEVVGNVLINTGDMKLDNGIALKSVNWDMTLSTNSGEHLRVKDSGFVGIGTITPTVELEVVGEAKIRNDSSGAKLFFDSAGIDRMIMGSYASINNIDNTNRQFKVFNDTEANAFVVNTSGQVGLGQAVPDTLLHLGNATNKDLIHFDTERSWKLVAKGTGVSTTLDLESENSAKDFRITKQADSNVVFTARPSAISADQIVLLCETGGNVGIGNTNPSKVLEITSTTSGFLPPRMTTAQQDLITPTAGECIYNTTTNKLRCYNGTIWNDCF